MSATIIGCSVWQLICIQLAVTFAAMEYSFFSSSFSIVAYNWILITHFTYNSAITQFCYQPNHSV